MRRLSGMILRILAIILCNLALIKVIALAVGPYYIDPVAGACAGTYSIANRDCTGTDGTSYATQNIGTTAVVAGETIYIRQAGLDPSTAYTSPIVMGTKRGTAGAYIHVVEYPGDQVIIRPVGAVSSIQRSTSGMSYVRFAGLEFDGVNTDPERGLVFNFGEHHYTFEDTEIHNYRNSGLLITGDGVVVRRAHIHHNPSPTCAPGTRYYGIYFASGADGLLEDVELDHNPGGGMQVYPGPITGLTILRPYIHDNNECTSSSIGGVLVGSNAHGTRIIDGIISKNGTHVNAGTAYGVSSESGVDNVELINLTIVDNKGPGIFIKASDSSGWKVTNSLVVGNGTGQIVNNGTGTILTSNRTTGVATDCLISPSTYDFRLKTGTNPCRNAGSTTATRPAPVDAPDIGAYEQGKFASVEALATGGFQVTVAVMNPGVQPTTAITPPTVTCIGCTGTPVAATGSVKAGSDNVVIFPLSGLSSSGTCTLTFNSTNIVDSRKIGFPTTGLAQGINTISGLSVSGNCANSSGGSPPAGMTAHYNFNASNATDQTVNGNNGTVSAGITFPSGFEGLAASIPSDGTFKHIAYPVGASTNLGNTDVSWCGVVTPDLTLSQKVVFSSGGNGTNQRFYVGWATVGGQQQWGIGVGNSGFLSGSEFPVTANAALVCLINNAATDTVYLEVNKVRGTVAGKSFKAHAGHTTVATNFRIGNDGTFTANSGGFTVDQARLWIGTALSEAEVDSLYDSLFAASAGLPCYAQSHVQFEEVRLVGGVPVIKPSVNNALNVVANGAVAIRVQITCTGSAGAEISVAPYYSLDGSTFNLRVPGSLGLDAVAMWGDDTDPILNSGVATGCINATGLTPNDGSTVLTGVTSPTFTLAQNHCTSYRIIVRVGNIAGQSRYFQFKQDNGQPLLGGYAAVPRINVIDSQASMMGGN